MPKSYLSDEPACQRAERCWFDPFLQVAARLRALTAMGHVTDKVELIVLGGTWSDYPESYQRWFTGELFRALNLSDEERVREATERRTWYERRGLPRDRDALAAALLDLGYDINTTDEGQLTEAFELVKNAKDKGVYQAFVMDEVFGKMEGGNAAITMYYAGDYLTMLENNEDLAFVIPEEGSNWFVDAMCVLKSSQHKAEAYEWINFIASTDSNLANMDYIWYASPNAEALAEYPAYYEEQYGEPLDEEIYNIMAIPDEERERCEIYVNLPQETLKFYDKLWTQLGV